MEKKGIPNKSVFRSAGILLAARPQAQLAPHSQNFLTHSFSWSNISSGELRPYLIPKETSSSARVLSHQMCAVSPSVGSNEGSPRHPLSPQGFRGLWACTAPARSTGRRWGPPGSDLHQAHSQCSACRGLLFKSSGASQELRVQSTNILAPGPAAPPGLPRPPSVSLFRVTLRPFSFGTSQ